MNHGKRPHAKQQREPEPTNGEEINHQLDPERTFEAHLGEHSKRWNKSLVSEGPDWVSRRMNSATPQAHQLNRLLARDQREAMCWFSNG